MDASETLSVRRFNRTVTRRVGVFTDRFLGRDRPLGEARLIFEIGREGCDVRELRAQLDFDSGYLSRLLRSLERQNLIEVVPHQRDRRIRRARLTPAGDGEFSELNRRGDEFAESLLGPLTASQRQRLALAMEQVERLLRLSAITITLDDPSSPNACSCLERYFAELNQRFENGFDLEKSISAEPQESMAPRGAFLTARLDGHAVGCGALKTLAPGIGTIKRMWVAESVRGLGLGSRMLAALETQASELGMTKLRLETNRSLSEAHALYRHRGYREVAAFNDDPHADFWFEKTL
jgi:DNA-binding MarR family transcriptional regulator/GNAT superfamily N-acetyltransferase